MAANFSEPSALLKLNELELVSQTDYMGQSS